MKELLNPTHKPGRSGKDLSYRKVFPLKAGQLLPIVCEPMVPNDYMEIDTASLIRTLPLNTAAFIRCRVHYDFFFVPYTAVWRNWDRFYYQRNDRETDYMNNFAFEPNLTLEDIARLTDYGGTTDIKNSKVQRAKLMELMGYGRIAYRAASDYASGGAYQSIGQKSLTILPLLMYNRIYNFWYRNAWRDEPTANDSHTYSADSWDCGSYAASLLGVNYPYGYESELCKVHYHGWFSDLFMGSLPNQQFGTVSTVLSTSSYLSSSQSSSATQVLGSTILSSKQTLKSIDFNSPSNVHDVSLFSEFDIYTLRKALALQKWKEYNMRAGWKGHNQARAMFGVSTPEDRKHEIEFLKGYDFPVMIDEVISQNGATGGNLGELAGKGIGVGNGEKFSFNCGERHGYLFCIAYVMPEVEYDASGIEKFLVRSEPFDHYVPAFENLGMEPIYKYELEALGNPLTFDSVLGYAPRYHEYKTRVDKVYGNFVTGGNMSSWVSVRRDLAGIANSGSIPTDYFYVNPSVLDTVFAKSADATLDSDQFFINFNLTNKAVRPMSDLGLPNL